MSRIAPEAEKEFRDGDYRTSLQILAGLRGPVDGFFDHVMVNTEDESLRPTNWRYLPNCSRQ